MNITNLILSLIILYVCVMLFKANGKIKTYQKRMIKANNIISRLGEAEKFENHEANMFFHPFYSYVRFGGLNPENVINSIKRDYDTNKEKIVAEYLNKTSK